jgi:hypothetical protein
MPERIAAIGSGYAVVPATGRSVPFGDHEEWAER